MTLSCPDCKTTDVEMTGDNGAEYPETRVEFYDCRGCGSEFKKVLVA